MRFLLIISAVFVACLTVTAEQTAAQTLPTRLAPGDELEITVFSRPEYDTTSVIGSEGDVAVNGLGRLPVAGLTSAEVEGVVREALLELRMTLPLVTVRVVSFRDVAVLGDVANPGLYRFRPDMTVLHALAQAGGFYRPGSQQSDDDVSIVDAQSKVSSLLETLALAEIRQDRIRAQMDETPVAAANDQSDTAPYRQAEAEIANTFVATRARDRTILEQQLQAIEKQIGLRLEISATYRDQLQAAKEDVARAEKLFEDGLVRVERLADARDKLSKLTIDNLENEAAYSSALQDRAQVELALASLGSSKTQDLAEEFRDVTSQISELHSEIEGARQRLRALQLRAGTSSMDADLIRYVVGYVVTRRTRDGGIEQIDAAETDIVQPGDVVTVTRRVQDK